MQLTMTLGASFLVTTLATLFALTCLFMMLVILIQKPKGGGLSGAFGGAGGSAQAAFGAKTGDLLTTITIGCFVAFLGLAIGLVYAIRDDVTPKTAPVTQAVGTPSTDETGAETPGTVTTDPAEAATDAEKTLDDVSDAEAEAENTDAPVESPAPDAQP